MPITELESDDYYMREALKQAKMAFDSDEVPIGAIIVQNGCIIAKAYNLTEALNDPTAHAEMLAITMATNAIGSKYLTNCTLYVTVEPCPMCAAALAWAQISKIVYAAKDPKKGYSLFAPNLLHPKTEVLHGIMQQEAKDLMITFFSKLRT